MLEPEVLCEIDIQLIRYVLRFVVGLNMQHALIALDIDNEFRRIDTSSQVCSNTGLNSPQ